MRNTIFIFLFVGIFLGGCANRVTPTGGEKDVKPPVLLSSVPENNTTNYSSPTIVLTFDEYIQLKEINTQLVVSPPIQPAPLIEIRKKSVVIEPGDSLLPNTTYTINFGNAIADNNEGNPLPGFRYVFSTGTYIDSLTVKGKIVDALTNKPQQGALALLYSSVIEDSLLLNKLPDYFSRTDSSGRFLIPNIKPGNYRIFALTEKNNNYIYDQSDELAGFIPESFALSDSAEFEISVNKQAPKKQSIKNSTIREPGVLVTSFANPAKELTWKFPRASFDSIITEYSSMGDTVSMYCFPPVTDTLSIIWFDGTTVIDTVKYQKPRGQVPVTSLVKKSTGYTIYPAKTGMLSAETTPAITWWAPIVKSDSSKIIFMKDSVIIPVSISFADSLQTVLKVNGDWREGNYLVSILPGAVTDIYGFTNDSIKSSFSFPPEKTKGSISYKFMMLQPGSHLLQLVNDKFELVRQRVFDQQISGVFELVDPGTYRLRVISDFNMNRKWDGGDFRKGILPEEVRYYNEPILVRSNWEVEIEWVK